MKKVVVKMTETAYETAKAEAEKNGFACTGSKVSFDINKHYERKARKEAK